MFRSRSQKYKRPFATQSAAAIAASSPLEQPSRMTLFCMNCGKNNHGYAQCQEPLSSYGIICFSRNSDASSDSPNTGEYQIVMVRRRHTMSYVEFLRGKYDVNNAEYLVELFSGMTRTEIEFITANPDFERLRRDLGMDNNWKRAYKAEYDNSELKFNYILNLGILTNIIRAVNHIWGEEFAEVGLVGNQALSLVGNQAHGLVGNQTSGLVGNQASGLVGNQAHGLVGNQTSGLVGNQTSGLVGNQTHGLVGNTNLSPVEKFWGARLAELRTRFNPEGSGGKLHAEPEWGIPKGKRQNKETDLQCAIREFQEETQLSAVGGGGSLLVYKNIIPLEEVYKGGNGVEYRHIYFIAELVAPVASSNLKDSLGARKQIETDEEIGAVGLFNMQEGLGQIRDYHVSKKNIIQKAFYIINSVGHFFTAGF